MADVISGGFGEPESPEQQAESLERLRFVMQQIPDLSVAIHAPDVIDPVVINIKRAQAIGLWVQLRWQIDLINAELALCASAKIAAPASLQQQIATLVDDVSKLQKELACVRSSSSLSS